MKVKKASQPSSMQLPPLEVTPDDVQVEVKNDDVTYRSQLSNMQSQARKEINQESEPDVDDML